jgi:PPE-repeat protein
MGSGAQRKAREPDIAAAAAAAGVAAREKRAVRRRLRAKLRGYGDEYMDMNVEVEPDWDSPQGGSAASDRGAGPLGFVGTTRRDAVDATGLATLTDREFGDGPSVPMVPGTWGPNHDPERSE